MAVSRGVCLIFECAQLNGISKAHIQIAIDNEANVLLSHIRREMLFVLLLLCCLRINNELKRIK